MKKVLLTALLLVSMAINAYAVPTLQLGIDGGYYDTTTQTIVASSPTFDLKAYLVPETNNATATLSDTYWISVGLLRADGGLVSSGADLGSFSFAGANYNVTGDMTYGTPPLALLGDDYLQTHGVFPTYFIEKDFTFPAGNVIYPAINTKPGEDGQPVDQYWKSFAVDITNLNSDYRLHFDLYTLGLNQSETGMIVTDFAPFSHDAQSGPPVPEPATLLLLGTGFLGLAIYGKRRRNI